MKRKTGLDLINVLLRGSLLLWSFLVSDALQLRITPASKLTIQSRVAANFPFDPPVEVELVDGSGNRITSGADSSLSITPVLSNLSVCLSVDAGFSLSSGVGRFPGSICEPISVIRISFNATAANGSSLWSDSTPDIEVTGEFHVANFHPTQKFLSGKLETFMMYAAKDVNDGTYGTPPVYERILPIGRTLRFNTYYHNDTAVQAIQAYQALKLNSKIYPSTKPYAMIGFHENKVSRVLLPIAMMEEISVLSHDKDTLPEFSDKTKYPHFNRLLYGNQFGYHGFSVFLSERKWTKIVMIKTYDSEVTNEFNRLLKERGITILRQIVVPEVSSYENEPAGTFRKLLEPIKKVGTRIIISAVKDPTATYLFMEANDLNITAKDGYQWLAFNTENAFPQYNIPSRCRDLPHGVNTDRMIKKCMEVCMRASYYIFCRRNKKWTNPGILNFY